MIRKISNRIYSDFLLPSRLDEYRSILKQAINQGYEMHSIRSFWELVKLGRVDPEQKYFISRHDIDTDISVAKSMFDIEKELNVPASYYFRLSTLDYRLMNQIEQDGSEASYHYEELATIAKERSIKTREEVERYLPEMRERFKGNLLNLRKQSGLPMTIVASHGDFANRSLEMSNTTVLEDEQLRKEMGIELEVYDEPFMKYVTSRHADLMYPRFYRPTSPVDGINKGEKNIYFLTHPRHWRANPKENLFDNLKRLKEGIKYSYLGVIEWLSPNLLIEDIGGLLKLIL